ncbi:MAG: glycine zipper 2TM domain-containing protein [Nitrosopumilaceae archaeon]
MKRTIIFSLIVFAAIFSATSAAQNIQAKVIKSIPVQSTHEFVDERRICTTQQVRVPTQVPVYTRERSTTAPVIGAIVGAALGHSITRTKEYKKEAAIAGAIAGAYSQRNRTRKVVSGYRTEYVYETQEICETEYVPRSETYVTGYQVTYEFFGETMTAIMPEQPGEYVNIIIEASIH